MEQWNEQLIFMNAKIGIRVLSFVDFILMMTIVIEHFPVAHSFTAKHIILRHNIAVELCLFYL